MLLQSRDEFGHERHQAFSADPVGAVHALGRVTK